MKRWMKLRPVCRGTVATGRTTRSVCVCVSDVISALQVRRLWRPALWVKVACVQEEEGGCSQVVAHRWCFCLETQRRAKPRAVQTCSNYSSYYDRVWWYLCVQKLFANWRRSSLQPGSSYTGQPQTELTWRRHTFAFLALMKCLRVLHVAVNHFFQSWIVIRGRIKL